MSSLPEGEAAPDRNRNVYEKRFKMESRITPEESAILITNTPNTHTNLEEAGEYSAQMGQAIVDLLRKVPSHDAVEALTVQFKAGLEHAAEEMMKRIVANNVVSRNLDGHGDEPESKRRRKDE